LSGFNNIIILGINIIISSWVEAVTLIHDDGSKVHTTFDTMDNIDLDRMEDVARLILYYIDKNAY